MKALYRLLVFTLALSVILSGLPPVQAQLSDPVMQRPNLQPFRLGNTKEPRELKSSDKKTLEDIFRKVDPRAVEPPPIDLTKTRVPGLGEKALAQLSMNYFLVTQGPSYKKMSDVYAANRAEGKPNFVTVDSIIHPYFGFANGLLATAIEESVIKDLQVLLRAMLTSSIADYKRTADEEVKDDIQRNLAYLCVALRLLEPNTKLPDIGGASELVDADLALLEAGKFGKSRIFNLEQDFGTYKAWGFMAQRPRLRRFFTCYQWLSRISFPLSNSTDGSIESGGNSFRRAVLLYRSIVLANTGKEAALEKWNRIALLMAITGFDSNAKKKTIVLPEFEPVLKPNEIDFARLLNSLAQPLFRTKLLLSVRNQRPVALNSRSVFEMDSAKSSTEDVVFRFFPLVDPPEMVWLREEGHDYMEATDGAPRVPLGLIDLHAHGAQQATNVLSTQIDSLDKGLSKRVPRLERLVRLLSAEDAGSDRHWAIVSNLYRQYPDTVQICLRSELWLNRQLETALAAWVDSYCACIMVSDPAASSNATDATPNAAGAGSNTASSSTSGENIPRSNTRSAVLKNRRDVGAASPGAGETPALPGSNTPRSNVASSNAASSNAAGPKVAGSNAASSNATGSNVVKVSASYSGSAGFQPASKSPNATGSNSTNSPSSNKSPKENAPVSPARFHYLEPRVEIYKVLQEDANNLVTQLTELKYMPPRYVQRQQDFLKLLKRLVAISNFEIKNEPIPMSDFNLLANIDRVLEPVDSPFASYIHLDVTQKVAVESSAKSSKSAGDKTQAASVKEPESAHPEQSGAAIGIGRAGKLYVVCSTSQGPMLTRGGCYTYYEINSGPLKDELWERKMKNGLLKPPFWTRLFEMAQESASTEKADTAAKPFRIHSKDNPEDSSPSQFMPGY